MSMTAEKFLEDCNSSYWRYTKYQFYLEIVFPEELAVQFVGSEVNFHMIAAKAIDD